MSIDETMFFNPAHVGYLDGLIGIGPSSEGLRREEYVKAHAIGAADRLSGVQHHPLMGKPCDWIRRGDRVRIPNGTAIRHPSTLRARRTYTVEVKSVDNGIKGYFERHWDNASFVRPTMPRVVWAGSGGYWASACACDVEKVDA